MGNFNDCFNTKSILFLNLRNIKIAINMVNKTTEFFRVIHLTKQALVVFYMCNSGNNIENSSTVYKKDIVLENCSTEEIFVVSYKPPMQTPLYDLFWITCFPYGEERRI